MGIFVIKTGADTIYELIKKKKSILFTELTTELKLDKNYISKCINYLEDLGCIYSQFTPNHKIFFGQDLKSGFAYDDKQEVINEIKILLESDDIRKVNQLLYELFKLSEINKSENLKEIYKTANKFFYDYLKSKNLVNLSEKDIEEQIKSFITVKDSYQSSSSKFSVNITIVKQDFDPVPFYLVDHLEFENASSMIVKNMINEVIREISIESINIKKENVNSTIKMQFEEAILKKLKFLLISSPEEQVKIIANYLTVTSFGLGDIELLLLDGNLEEIAINNAKEPVWVYHKKHSWLKTNILIKDEETIKHFASLAGRIVNRDITLLNPLLDAHLETGDRMNATLNPISSRGNTITIRKFASNPWTITSFLRNGTIDYESAAIIWTAIQYELSLLIVGGTGSGKTSILNVVSNFFSPTHRIISIEDTRELVLPDTLHWVPLETRLPNPEGQGEISMLDLVVNSLRMRPDRILVGEIRRKREAEVLFEAMHTGHSVYATLHANSVEEAVMRLTNPPIDLPKNMINSLSLLIVQNRNRRTGKRRTFQIAEILESGDYNLLYELDVAKDKMNKVNELKRLTRSLELFGGLTPEQISNEIGEKIIILKYLVERNIDDVNKIGSIISDYYLNKEFLFMRLFEKDIKKR